MDKKLDFSRPFLHSNYGLILIVIMKLTLLLLCQKILIKRLLNNGWGFLYAVSASWNVAYATRAESADPS